MTSGSALLAILTRRDLQAVRGERVERPGDSSSHIVHGHVEVTVMEISFLRYDADWKA